MSSSQKNADPNIWGPPMWDLLFTFAYKLPDDVKEKVFTDLFRQLELVLPCQHCRRSYIMYRKQVPKKDEPAEWLWMIHDMVNQNLGKICIEYGKLESRHAVFTCLTHPFTVIDLFCIMSNIIKHKHLFQFIQTVLQGARACPGLTELSDAFDDQLCETNLYASLWKAHSHLRNTFKVPAEDYDRFWLKYNPEP